MTTPIPPASWPFHLPMTHQAQIPGRSLQVNSLHAFGIHILLNKTLHIPLWFT